MKVKQSHRVRLLQKVTILVFLTFLAYGDRNTMVAGMNKKFAAVVLEKPLQKQQRMMPQQQQQQQQKQQQQQQQQQQQENRYVNHRHHNHHSMDLFTSSKRRVPNASDPLHNR